MKELKLFTYLLIMSCFTVIAQESNTTKKTTFQGINFGIKAGLNMSNLYGDVDPDAGNRFGFHVGGIVNTPIVNNIVIQLEPTFSREGNGGNNSSTSRIDYFNLPFLVKIYSINDWSFEAGPKVGFKISEVSEDTNGIKEKRDRFKTISPSIVVGASYSLNKNWVGQFRFNYTPSDIVKKDAGDREGTSSGVFQFSLGYFFD